MDWKMSPPLGFLNERATWLLSHCYPCAVKVQSVIKGPGPPLVLCVKLNEKKLYFNRELLLTHVSHSSLPGLEVAQHILANCVHPNNNRVNIGERARYGDRLEIASSLIET